MVVNENHRVLGSCLSSVTNMLCDLGQGTYID